MIIMIIIVITIIIIIIIIIIIFIIIIIIIKSEIWSLPIGFIFPHGCLSEVVEPSYSVSVYAYTYPGKSGFLLTLRRYSLWYVQVLEKIRSYLFAH